MHSLVRFALVAFYPAHGGFPGLGELDVDARIAEFRREATSFVWVGLVFAAVIFHLTPLLTIRRFDVASALSEDDLDAHVRKMASHPAYLVRQLMLLIKLFGGLFWAESPEVRAKLGLMPYPRDPGTRRLGSIVRVEQPGPRAPHPMLVALGQRERERGRDGDYDAAVGKTLESRSA